MNVGGIIALSVMIPVAVFAVIVIVVLALLRWNAMYMERNHMEYDRAYQK